MKHPLSAINFLNKLSLRWKLSVVISLLVILMGGITVFLVNTKVTEILHDELVDRGVTISRNLALNIVNPLLVDNRILLTQQLMNIYSNEKGISYIFVFDPEKNLLAHTFKNGFPTDLRVSVKQSPDPNNPSLQEFDTEEGLIHHVIMPILKGKAGYIHLGLNDREQSQKIAIINKEIRAIAILIIVIGFVIAFFVAGAVTRHLSDLTKALKFSNIRGHSQPLPVTSQDEVGLLTEKFNDMTAELNTYLMERDAAEEALANSENLYRSLVENIDLGITFIDKDFNVIMANAGQGKMFHCDPKNFNGHKCFVEFEKRKTPCDHCPGKISMEKGTPAQAQATGVRDDGSQFTVLIRTFPVKGHDDHISGFIEVVDDISERLEMEEEITKAKQIESIGVLAGGIAHDFNNLLTSVFGNLELAQINIHDPETASLRLAEIENVCVQAKHLTAQLLTFSKGGAPIREKILLPEFIEETCLAFLPDKKVRFSIDIPDTIWDVMLDRIQIERVIREILENSCDAMPPGEGFITISASNFSMDNATQLPITVGDYVKLKITDNGSGISPNIIGKIFDPYFTTKEMGASKGIGLGLSICHSIISKHDGLIQANNLVSGGSEIIIYLPANEPSTEFNTIESFMKEYKEQKKVEAGKLHILFLEDEMVVSDTVSKMMHHLGYAVDFFSDGESAVQACREAIEGGNPYDLAILDLSIDDGMGGLETFREILAFEPYFKAVVSSGYTDDPIMADYADYGFKGALPKPYNIQKLDKKIQEIMTAV